MFSRSNGSGPIFMTMNERLSAALLDRYRIERELGAGGMATVYLARDIRHDRDVAIKVLHPDLGAALGSERFLAEIRTTARLQHPHILPLLDSGAADGLLYYVMPFVAGETLRAKLTRDRQLSLDQTLRIGREVADALGHAHGLGIVHRDIKPENILLQGGHALVADFGIALAVQHAGGQRMTQTGLSLGTPQYMSPEQAMGERTIDARSDIYALGAVTYEMLTGDPPFTGSSVQAIVAKVLTEKPVPPHTVRDTVPDSVEFAVLKALAKLPADRFASAPEFAAALEVRDTVATRQVPARRFTKESRIPLATTGALALLSAVAARLGWSRTTPTPEVVRYRVVIDSVPAVKDWTGELAISPDGSTIVRPGGSSAALLMRRRDELEFTQLAGTEGATAPFFSPNGTQIAFYANNTIMTVPLAGGPPTTIADTLYPPETASWGEDGYLYRAMVKDGRPVIARSRPSAGAHLDVVASADTAAGELGLLHPELLPGGKALLFHVMFRDGRQMIAVGDMSAQRHTTLLAGIRPKYVDGHLLYTAADGKLWAISFNVGRRTTSGTAVQVGDRIPTTIVGPVDFAVSKSGTLVYSAEDAGGRRELTWVTRDGKREPVDSTWKADFWSPNLSPNGSRIAVVVRRGAGQSDIWTKSASPGAPAKLTVEHRNNLEPAWSPDGKWVSYIVAQGSGNSGDVWRQRADGGDRAERIVASQRQLSEQTYVPVTSATLVRTTSPTTGAGDVLIMRPGVDREPVPVLSSPNPEYSPIASPDGKWLAYTSNESGRYEIYVTALQSPNDARWPVSTGGGITPRWSRRGNELFYLDLRSNMVAAQVTTSPSFSVVSTRVLFNASDFIQAGVSRRNFDVDVGDQRFLMVQRADAATRGQVVVVEHWLDEMRRKGGKP